MHHACMSRVALDPYGFDQQTGTTSHNSQPVNWSMRCLHLGRPSRRLDALAEPIGAHDARASVSNSSTGLPFCPTVSRSGGHKLHHRLHAGAHMADHAQANPHPHPPSPTPPSHPCAGSSSTAGQRSARPLSTRRLPPRWPARGPLTAPPPPLSLAPLARPAQTMLTMVVIPSPTNPCWARPAAAAAAWTQAHLGPCSLALRSPAAALPLAGGCVPQSAGRPRAARSRRPRTSQAVERAWPGLSRRRPPGGTLDQGWCFCCCAGAGFVPQKKVKLQGGREAPPPARHGDAARMKWDVPACRALGRLRGEPGAILAVDGNLAQCYSCGAVPWW